jgi:SPP1 gp7 family putative phage head morphogenesis protein
LALNCVQFSAAKDVATTKALQSLVSETDSFGEFKTKASEIVNITNDVWLRTEMDTVRRAAVMGESYRAMQRDSELYPYWQYSGELDDRERDSHLALEGLIFKIGDPEGDAIVPPNDFSCRCKAVPIDGQDLNESGKDISKGSDYLTEKDKDGEDYVDPKFRYCPADQVLPNTGGYFDVLKNINKLDAEDFDL